MFLTYHDFTVILFVYILITEDVAGTKHSQFASFLHNETRLNFNTPFSLNIAFLWTGYKIIPSDLSLMEGQNRPVEGEAL